MEFRGSSGLDVKAEFDDVPILHDVFLAFNAQLSVFARSGLAAARNEIVIMDDFRGQ